MKTLTFSRYALSFSVAALLAGCGASQPPTAAREAMFQSMRPSRDGSRLFVDANCVFKPFSGMCVFSFPSGHYVDWIEYHNFARILGMCQGPRGYIFITGLGYDGGLVVAYNYGGSSTNSLNDGQNSPQGCSYDATSRRLAVANIAAYGQNGNLSVFNRGMSYPTVYTSPDFASFTYCSYDDQGNLFVDGTDASGNFRLAELAKGARKLKTISLNNAVKLAGPIQWDGRHLAVGYGNVNASLIFQVDVSGSKARVVGSTRLKPRILLRTQFGPFWIQGNRIVASFNNQGAFPIGIWSYPAGGDPLRLIRRGTNSRRQRIMTVGLSPG